VTKSLEATLSWLYLKGITSGEMGEALEALVDPDAEGPSNQHSIPAEAGLGARVPGLVRGTAG